MNATAYISSGILERHTVGLTTEEEQQELTEMRSQHSEIGGELAAVQQALQGYVMAHRVAPPDDLREKLMAGAQVVSQPAAMPAQPTKQSPTQAPAKAKKTELPAINWWPIAAAVLGLGLVVAGVMAANFSKEVEAGKANLEAAQVEIEKLKAEKAARIKQYETVRGELDMLRDSDTKPIQLLGTYQAKNTRAIIYWNGAKKASYINVKKLPEVPDGEQLQLWVTASGKTENLGGLSANEPALLPELKFIEKPTHYFVTLEKAGDAPERPNRWRVVMLGTVL